MITEARVLDALRGVVDPDLGRDIVSLGFIKDLDIDGGKVRFSVELTTPACPVRDTFKTQCEQAVKALPGVESVSVTMKAQPPRRAPSVSPNGLEKVHAIVAVAACKGGVGKSTVAAHLARAMRREGLAVGLLDADIYGPSIPTLFAVHRPDLYVSDQLLLPVETEGLKLMSLGFILGESPAVLRGPIVSNYTAQILHQTNWGALDYLIIDMPPGTGDIQLTIVQQATLDGAIMVTTPQALSLVDVARGIIMFEKVNVPVLGLVENMSYFVCDKCHKKHHLFGSSTGSLKERFGLETLAQLPILPGISSAPPDGGGPVADAFRALAENVHRAIGVRRARKGDVPTVTPESGHLHIRWRDGSETILPNRTVRASCPCAQCMDEITGRRTLDPTTIPDSIAVESIQPLGNYAVSIHWSDGHSTGIYSWDHLRSLVRQG